jgi:hypothetical protein
MPSPIDVAALPEERLRRRSGPVHVPPVARSTSSSIARPASVGGAVAVWIVTGFGATTGRQGGGSVLLDVLALLLPPVEWLISPQSLLEDPLDDADPPPDVGCAE